MKYKTMYGLHELRMWLATIIGGVATVGAVTATHPELVEGCKKKFSNLKAKVKNRKKLKIVVVDSNNEEKP